MATITSSLGNAGSALDVIQQALNVVQANVSNSNTPGYATQQLSLNALSPNGQPGLPLERRLHPEA